MLLKSESHSSSEKNKSNYMRKSFNSSQDNHSLVQLVERWPGCAGASWERGERQRPSLPSPSHPRSPFPQGASPSLCGTGCSRALLRGQALGTSLRLHSSVSTAGLPLTLSWAGRGQCPLERPLQRGCCSCMATPRPRGWCCSCCCSGTWEEEEVRVLGQSGAGEGSKEPIEML